MSELKEKKAAPRERTIELKISFWTNGLATKEAHIIPKNAWTNGTIRIKRNNSHNIIPGNDLKFNSLAEIMPKIEECLIEHGITLHVSKNMEKYIKVD